jgi:hypothetical protein
VTGLLCWWDFHPLEWQLASLHRLLTFPTWTRAARHSLGLLVDREISRVPHKKRTHMPGSLRPRRVVGALAIDAPLRFAFRKENCVDTRSDGPFAARWLAYAPPVNASPRPSRVTAHDSGPMWFAIPSL